jgi:protoheme ferro-lyase
VVGVSLYSHKATRRGGAVVQAFLKAFDEASGISVSVIERLSSDPGYVELLRKQLSGAPGAVGAEAATVVFAAPGVERADLDTGDDYRPQIEATAEAAMNQIPLKYKVAWLGEKMPGPLLPAVLEGLGAEGVKAVLLVPLGTTVDELGVVHALDIEARELAKQHGITRVDRAPQLLGEPGFAALVHKMVDDHVMRVGALGLA